MHNSPATQGRQKAKRTKVLSTAEKIAIDLFHPRKGKYHLKRGPELKIRRVRYVLSKNRKRKGVVAKAIGEDSIYFSYYPLAEHAKQFSNASKPLVAGGPSSVLPGSVGVLRILLHGKVAEITHLQGAFSQKAGKLSRSMVSKHGGWRQHILKALFEELKTRKINEFFIRSQKENQSMSKTSLALLEDFAKQNGFIRTSDQTFIRQK